MRIFALVAFVLSLAACQSCKDARTPAPPVPESLGDSGTLADAAGRGPAVLADAGAPEASAPDAGPPSNLCLSSLIGTGHAFCDGPTPFSSSTQPASPAGKGKLASLKSDATARTRLIIRHSNGSKAKMKVVVVLTNDGPAQGSLALLKKGVAGPITDPSEGESLAVGRWSASTPRPGVLVAPGKSVRFDASVEVGLPEKYATIGLYEYSFGQPHTVHVCFVGEREDWSVCPSL